jgi:hypothetical protein
MCRFIGKAAAALWFMLGVSSPSAGQATVPTSRTSTVSILLQRLATGTPTVSFGLPLARGAAADPSSIAVYIGTTPIAATITPLLRDHDAAGTITGLRAVRIQFAASLMPGPTLTVGVMLGGPGGSPAGAVVPFSAVSAESPETVTVADRTIVQEGTTYRLAESNRRTMTLFTGREPAVLAIYPPGYLAQSGILGPQVSAADLATDPDHAGVTFFSDYLAPFVRSATYEEAYALNPAPTSVVDPVASYEGWLYDRCATLLTGYVHADDPAMLRHALRACSYYSSKITLDPGTNRGIFTGKPERDTKYSHLRGLFAYYALTGDEGALAAGTAIADLWLNDLYFVGPYRQGHIRGVDKLWTERLLGTSLEGLYYGFRLTNNTAYLAAFKEVVTTAYRHITTTDQAELAAITKDPNAPPFPPQNCFVHNALQASEGSRSEPWCSGWMSELVVDSLLAYQEQTNDPRVDEVFIRLARFLRDVGSSYLASSGRQDDTFLAPAVCFDPALGATTRARRLIPLYGSGLYADGSRHNAGEYSDYEHCPDATALTAAALRALVRQGKFDRGGPIGPFASEGASLVQLHHEFAFCAQTAFLVRNATQYHDPSVWTSTKLAAGASDPAAFIAKWGIGFPSYVTSPQRKLSWWFNTSMLQFGLLKDAGIKVPALRPGVVQPKGQPCPSR